MRQWCLQEPGLLKPQEGPSPKETEDGSKYLGIKKRNSKDVTYREVIEGGTENISTDGNEEDEAAYMKQKRKEKCC